MTFHPKSDRPRWQTIYDELCTMDVGDLLTYERLYELCDVERREQVRSPFYKAVNAWGRERKRAMRPEPNQGYVVVEASEHEYLARSQHRRSHRAMAKGRRIMANADRSRMNESQRQRADAMEARLSSLEDVTRRLDLRQARIEEALAQSDAKHDATDEELTRLRDLLRRHGINDPKEGS